MTYVKMYLNRTSVQTHILSIHDLPSKKGKIVHEIVCGALLTVKRFMKPCLPFFPIHKYALIHADLSANKIKNDVCS